MTDRIETALKRRAHALLDEVRIGIYHPMSSINWALRVLGEPVHHRGVCR